MGDSIAMLVDDDDMGEMGALFLAQLAKRHSQFVALYSEMEATAAPRKKEWLTSLGEPDNVTMDAVEETIGDSVTEFLMDATAMDIIAFLEVVKKYVARAKSNLDSLFYEENKPADGEGVTADQVREAYEAVVKQLRLCRNLVDNGYLTDADIAKTIPLEERKGGRGSTATHYSPKDSEGNGIRPPRKKDESSTPKKVVRSNSKRVGLIVNHEKVPGENLGAQCKAAGFSTQELQAAIAPVQLIDTEKYSEKMGTINGQPVGLYVR